LFTYNRNTRYIVHTAEFISGTLSFFSFEILLNIVDFSVESFSQNSILLYCMPETRSRCFVINDVIMTKKLRYAQRYNDIIIVHLSGEKIIGFGI